MISPDFSEDKYPISVGRDKDIAVKRQEVKDLTSKRIFGSSVKVVKCEEITVRNNKKHFDITVETHKFVVSQ